MFTLADDKSPFMYFEAYKNLRTNIEFLTFDENKKIIAVTSALSGEGKTCISINLALVLAESGKKVILIDADLRKSSIHKYLGVINQKGLTSIIKGLGIEENIILNAKDMGFDVILSGPKSSKPSEILSSREMKKLLDELVENYDYIIIDTPPVGVVTDTAILNKYIDGNIFVVAQNFATKAQIKSAYRNLKHVNANMLGVVLNRYNFKKDIKYLNGDNYYYKYYNTTDEEV